MRHLPNVHMQFFYPEHELTRTQSLEKSYQETGQSYWEKAST